MKLEILDRLKQSTAGLLRLSLASSWFWEQVPAARSVSVRGKRQKLRRAAAKAKGNPVRFVERYFGRDWFKTGPLLRERAALAISDVLSAVVRGLEAPESFGCVTRDRQIVNHLRNLFVSLAAQPGRPPKNKYRVAAAFRAKYPKTSIHRLCVLFDPGYSSMNHEKRVKAHDRLRAAINRVFKVAVRVVS